MEENLITILLIEDNAADARFVEKMLAGSQSGSFAIECVDRLSQGLTRLAAGGVDIILLDLSLPDAQGLDTFRIVHDKFPSVPIVVLTGLNDEEFACEAVKAGAQDYLLKSDVAEWLGRSIRYAIARQLSDRELQQVNDELARRVNELADANQDLNDLTVKLEAARDEALQASRAKSAFLANMSHELRTPLSGMISAAELLSVLELGHEESTLVELLKTSSTSLLSILNDILDMAKIEAGRVVLENIIFNVLFVIQDSARCMSVSAATKGLAFHCNLDYRLPELVSGDPVRLRQVLLNLIGNAIKFTEKGEVVVAADLLKADDDRCLIKFSVSDTGIGITEEQRERLFMPFVQADESIARSYGGTGLGLSISRQLVEMMGGELGFTSRPGIGTTFSFTVPFQLPVSKSPSLDALSPGEGRGTMFQGLALIVEDNLAISELTLRQLAKLGVQGFMATSGQAALQALSDKHFDLILMDCQMPEMDGFEVTKRIQQLQAANKEHTPIIAMTAGVTAETRQKCLDCGMVDYLAKPVTLSSLEDILRRWMPAVNPAKWEQAND